MVQNYDAPQFSSQPSEDNGCEELITQLENLLFGFYGLDATLRAGDFLLDEEAHYELRNLQGKQKEAARETPSQLNRGSVWLINEPSEALFIGIHFQPQVIKELLASPPLESLHSRNLDAFCVVAEEISHFHLLTQRVKQGRHLSQLELEWQGDIDKALLAAAILQAQAGHHHLDALQHRLYEAVSYAGGPNAEHYVVANHYAAKFWHTIKHKGLRPQRSVYEAAFVELLRRNYQRPLEEKFPFVNL